MGVIKVYGCGIFVNSFEFKKVSLLYIFGEICNFNYQRNLKKDDYLSFYHDDYVKIVFMQSMTSRCSKNRQIKVNWR